ncbi:Ger(x)C family spore germination protein [Virgibacillus sp. MSP4-1]|uniref:Ger(x)C family spore germination protein n=1 Tax=Virgibacillus sp. MSP4-1 TaxID=2700081 RepID=UPI0003A792F6|nr:Ger(x)C family spore germination protein [Virgibacillus sp. MSP4-1]QHS21721.1 Ger(x)C family spore germination protein [Virgibacillus sp. MSP4-1]
MIKKLQAIALCFIVALGISGCWSSRELTDIAIVTALGIDKEGEEIKVTAQVINPSENAGQTFTTRTAVTTFTSTGKSLFETIRRLTTLAPRKLYLSHIRMIIFGEEYAKQGIGDSLDFISRDHEMRTDFNFAIARNYDAEDIINILTPIEKIPANKIYSTLKSSHNFWAPTKVVQLDELIASMTSKGKEAVLTELVILGDVQLGQDLENVQNVPPYASIKSSGLGVFKNDQLAGWLDEDQSRGFNIITNNIQNTTGVVPCGKSGELSVEAFKNSTELKGTIKGNKPKMKIKFTSEANIADVSCSIDFTNQKTLKKYEKKLENEAKNVIKTSVKRAQELEADIFGFGEVFSRSNPKKWKTMQKNWAETFVQDLKVDVKVDVKIRRTGTITQPFMKDISGKKQGDS